MIQFNLLPDVKIQYLKARYRQRLAVGASVAVSGFFLTVLILLFLFVRVAQPHQMDAVGDDIKSTTDELNKTKDLNKILTIQNQLKSLPGLHDSKVISSRLFDYLTKVTPAQASISGVAIDFTTNTLSLEGNTDAISTVNKFTDTLKFTTFSVGGDQSKESKAFSNVVLSSFSVATEPTGATNKNKQVTYKIDFTFDPAIFANTKQSDGKPTEVKLTVPKTITTRSELEQPGSLFEAQPVQNGGTN